MKRRKRMKIVLIIIGVLLLISGIFIIYRYNQLKKVGQIPTEQLLAAMTQKDGLYVTVAIIDHGNVTYHTYTQGGTEIDHITAADGTTISCNDLLYEIGSASKTMVGLMLSKAVEEGLVDINDPISEYLDLPEGQYYPTIARIMTHTAGYKNYYWENQMFSNHLSGRNDFYGITREQMLSKAASIQLEDKDYDFCYSNFGLSLIGMILEEVYHEDFTDLMNDYLHNTLSMNDTNVASCSGNLSNYWDWGENDGYIPAGAIISDIEDMVTYLNFYMQDQASYARPALYPISPVNNANNDTYLSMGIRIDEVGMAWMHDTERHFYWHNGGTSCYNSYIAISEDFTRGVVILSNYGPDQGIPVTVIGPRYMMQD